LAPLLLTMKSGKFAVALVISALALVAVLVVVNIDDAAVRESASINVHPADGAKSAAVADKPSDETTMKAAADGVSSGVVNVDEPATGDFPALAKKFSKGVVQIMVVKAKHQWLSPQKQPSTEEVSGSGWFVQNSELGPSLKDSKDLHIVTNAHVAMDAVQLTIRLPATGLLPIKCSVVGLSPPDEHDLALLKVEDTDILKEAVQRHTNKGLEDGMIVLPIGDSDTVQSGEKLMALGYPEGLPGVKSTLGVMSGYQEMSRKLYMQMTTPINPGNSGGPLICEKGHVIGVNTAGIEGSENIGFSIPAAVLKAVLPVLATHRVFTRPTFGIVLNPLGDKVNEFFNMPDDARGEYIAKVYSGGTADKAGIKAGDVLYEIDGMPVSRRGQMMLSAINAYVTLDGYLGRIPLDQKVTLKVWRGGKNVDLTMDYKITEPLAIPRIHEAALKPEIARQYQIKGGLVFTPLTQNFVEGMITPVDVGGGAVVPAPNLVKYGEYPKDRQAAKIVIADVISSSLAENTKVFDAAMVVDEVNGKKVTTMKELCAAMGSPVKDHTGREWFTLKDEDGNFGAMPWADCNENDSKLAAMGMMEETTCSEDGSNGVVKASLAAAGSKHAATAAPGPAGVMPPAGK